MKAIRLRAFVPSNGISQLAHLQELNWLTRESNCAAFLTNVARSMLLDRLKMLDKRVSNLVHVTLNTVNFLVQVN